jgi:hypothetical protein
MPNIEAIALSDFHKKILLKKVFRLPLQLELPMEFNSMNNFGRASSKRHHCKVLANLAK